MFKRLIFPKLLLAYIRYKHVFCKNVHSQPCDRRVHRNSPTYMHPQVLAWQIQYNIYIEPTIIPQTNIYIFLKMYISQPCAQRAHRNSSTYMHPQVLSWYIQYNIYIEPTNIPQIVGSIYPIQIYISKTVYSPTLCPKGAQKLSNLHAQKLSTLRSIGVSNLDELS